MQINSLTLVGFRNYREQTLAFDPACNVIHGENAQGKTNLLEAIVYLSCGKSPRTRSDRELITFDGQQARITGKIFSRDREFVTDITLQAGRRRKMTVNGVAAKNAAELSDVLHTVFFCPEDLFLIREGAAARRKFMDQSLCQLRPRYAQALAEYHRLYEHKTRILRDREDNPGLRAGRAAGAADEERPALVWRGPSERYGGRAAGGLLSLRRGRWQRGEGPLGGRAGGL